MIKDVGLHRIRTGEATAAEAKATVRAYLLDPPGRNYTPLYAVLRAWTFKTLNRRRDDVEELSAWWAVLHGAVVILEKADPPGARHVEALHFLLDDQLRVIRAGRLHPKKKGVWALALWKQRQG